jgi:hypothetical protein
MKQIISLTLLRKNLRSSIGKSFQWRAKKLEAPSQLGNLRVGGWGRLDFPQP